MTNEWYKNAIIYGLNVKSFKDSNSDGIGDFQGLISKLDYLDSMGINCLWLLPFYPSPKHDDGYDVSDYYGIDPDLGNFGDFVEFVHAAKARGINVLIDLVINHTSIEHPWFLDARKSRDSRYRDYYIWHDDPDPNPEKIMFEGIEDSIWEYTEETGSYYLHRFFKQQADLNISNPEVRREIIKIMGFWLKLGIDGFRIDAAHTITDPVDVEHVDFDNLHEFFNEMRSFIDQNYPNTILLGEANVPHDELVEFFGSEDQKPRMHMLFNFLSNKYTFLAMALKEGEPLAKGLQLYQDIGWAHWINFIRHHDELNLELLDDKEREIVFNAYAPEEGMRLFGHGIRRRVAPMFKNNKDKIKLIYAIAFSLPGSPLISYGEEICMGDDLSLQGRHAVRTVMQWMPEQNGGFSDAPKDKFVKPVIDHGEYHYKNINVLDQQKDPESFLNWITSLIKQRKQNPVIGYGKWQIVQSNDHRVIGLHYNHEGINLLTVFNLSGEEASARLYPDFVTKQAVPVLNDHEFEIENGFIDIKLPPYGFQWMEVLEKEEITYVNK
jgi:maltose alpha-D-glucosyltransferase / alpha-amylase